LNARSRALAAQIGPIAGLLLLGSLAFVRLTAMPMFEDEGSQLREVYRAIEASEWLAPLGTGKPLEAWPMVPLVWLGVPSLVALRAVHVLAGMLGVVLTYLLALRTSNRGTACISGVLFAICPLLVYLQRLALADMLLCTASVWVLVCAIAWLQSSGGPRTVALAVSLLVAALSKMPVGFVLLGAAPLALFLMSARDRARLQPGAYSELLLAHVPAAVLAAAVAVVAAVRVWRGQEPGFGLQTVMGIGLGYYGNMGAVAGVVRPDLLTEFTAQLSWPVVATGMLGVAAGALLGDWRQRWLAAAGLLPMLAIGYGAHFWYSRYLLFTLPPLTAAAVEGWRALLARTPAVRLPAAAGLLLICTVLMGRQSMLLILDPLAARWSRLDRSQYFESWSSGYGYPEAARFIRDSVAAPQVIFALDGHSADQLRSYLPERWGTRVLPIFQAPDGRLLAGQNERLENLRSHQPAWIVISVQLLDGYLQSVFGAQNVAQIELRKVATFDKPGSRAQIGIYLAKSLPLQQARDRCGPQHRETPSAPSPATGPAALLKGCE
jgi:hypothetical protein